MTAVDQSADTASLPAAEAAAPSAPASVPERRWMTVVHRGAWTVAALAAALVAVLVARLALAGASFAPEEHDPALVGILVVAAVVVAAVSVAILRPERGAARALITTSALWSVTFLVVLIAIWWLIDGSARQTDWFGTPLANQAAVDRYLDEFSAGREGNVSELVRIPTGFMLQSAEFLNANNVQISGFVWQQIGPDVPSDFVPGVVFPEAVKEAYAAQEAYRFDNGNGTVVIGWYIAATLRQSFDYGAFPLDRQDIWIRLWQQDLSSPVVLVPDFATYYDLDPASLPGIEDKFVSGGWEPLYSGFTYAANGYDAAFGLPAGQEVSAPELYFNLIMKRSFLAPFTDYVIFGLAGSLLLFGLLALTTSNEDLKTRFGLSTAGVLGSVSGLFFAVIVKHNQVRSSLATQQTTYIEILPYVMYALLVLVALNAILVSSPWRIRFVDYRHNLLPKVVYWPLLLGLLTIGTIWVFYRP